MAQYIRPDFGQALASGSLAGGLSKYTRVEAVTSTWFNTGSNAGGVAVMRGAAATGTVSASRAGALDVADLTVGTVYDIEPRAVSATAGTVYVLYR